MGMHMILPIFACYGWWGWLDMALPTCNKRPPYLICVIFVLAGCARSTVDGWSCRVNVRGTIRRYLYWRCQWYPGCMLQDPAARLSIIVGFCLFVIFILTIVFFKCNSTYGWIPCPCGSYKDTLVPREMVRLVESTHRCKLSSNSVL